MMHPYDQLLHDMTGVMCSALQYMKNAVEYEGALPITPEAVESTRAAMTKLIARYHKLREESPL